MSNIFGDSLFSELDDVNEKKVFNYNLNKKLLSHTETGPSEIVLQNGNSKERENVLKKQAIEVEKILSKLENENEHLRKENEDLKNNNENDSSVLLQVYIHDPKLVSKIKVSLNRIIDEHIKSQNKLPKCKKKEKQKPFVITYYDGFLLDVADVKLQPTNYFGFTEAPRYVKKYTKGLEPNIQSDIENVETDEQNDEKNDKKSTPTQKSNDKGKDKKDAQNNSINSASNTRFFKIINHHSAQKKFASMEPGFISLSLRKAMGIEANQLPSFYQRMTHLGYPPGYILQARKQWIDTIGCSADIYKFPSYNASHRQQQAFMNHHFFRQYLNLPTRKRKRKRSEDESQEPRKHVKLEDTEADKKDSVFENVEIISQAAGDCLKKDSSSALPPLPSSPPPTSSPQPESSSPMPPLTPGSIPLPPEPSLPTPPPSLSPKAPSSPSPSAFQPPSSPPPTASLSQPSSPPPPSSPPQPSSPPPTSSLSQPSSPPPQQLLPPPHPSTLLLGRRINRHLPKSIPMESNSLFYKNDQKSSPETDLNDSVVMIISDSEEVIDLDDDKNEDDKDAIIDNKHYVKNEGNDDKEDGEIDDDDDEVTIVKSEFSKKKYVKTEVSNETTKIAVQNKIAPPKIESKIVIAPIKAFNPHAMTSSTPNHQSFDLNTMKDASEEKYVPPNEPNKPLCLPNLSHIKTDTSVSNDDICDKKDIKLFDGSSFKIENSLSSANDSCEGTELKCDISKISILSTDSNSSKIQTNSMATPLSNAIRPSHDTSELSESQDGEDCGKTYALIPKADPCHSTPTSNTMQGSLPPFQNFSKDLSPRIPLEIVASTGNFNRICSILKTAKLRNHQSSKKQ